MFKLFSFTLCIFLFSSSYAVGSNRVKDRWRTLIRANRTAQKIGRIQLLSADSTRQNRILKMMQEALNSWQRFKRKHGKSYADDNEEHERMMHFLSRKEIVRRHNEKFENGEVSYKLEVNHLADLYWEEYNRFNGFLRNYDESMAKGNQSTFLKPLNINVPDHVDWRDHGYVTAVKNQGHCGSCWAFSSTGSLEGQHKRKTNRLVSLSEQNLVDCSEQFGNHGCNGGLMDNAFQYVKANGGIDMASAYPYEAKQRRCRFKEGSIGADDSGYVDIPSGDEEQLKIAISTQGPISVAIDAGHSSFMLYKKGIYYESQCNAQKLDHGVLVVGYGSDELGRDYWIVKNSWGGMWGEDGYIRMARNRDNNCGIATTASYPMV